MAGDGRRGGREIDVKAIGALWGDESVGVEAVFRYLLYFFCIAKLRKFFETSKL